jgi:hypothetical protein
MDAYKCASTLGSANQFTQLASFVFPLLGIGHGGFALGDAFPAGQECQFCVQLSHVLLVRRQIFLGIDRVDGAFGNAHGAIDALIGIDGQEVRAFAEAVHRANVHAVGVLALDTGFGNNMGHDGLGKWGERCNRSTMFVILKEISAPARLLRSCD